MHIKRISCNGMNPFTQQITQHVLHQEFTIILLSFASIDGLQLNYVSIESGEKERKKKRKKNWKWNVNRPNLNCTTTRRNERNVEKALDRTERNCLPNEIASKRKLVLAPRQLAINAALESLFGHEINSELASIIRGWISRWSSTRRVKKEKRERKKKDSTMLLSACFSSNHFNEQQTSKHTFPWNLADPLLQPRNLDHAYFRPSRPVSRTSDDLVVAPRIVRFLSEKIIRVNLISSLVA